MEKYKELLEKIETDYQLFVKIYMLCIFIDMAYLIAARL